MNSIKVKKKDIFNLNIYFNNCIDEQKNIDDIINNSINIKNIDEKNIIDSIIFNILIKKNINTANKNIIEKFIKKYQYYTNIFYINAIFLIIDTINIYINLDDTRKYLLSLINDDKFIEYKKLNKLENKNNMNDSTIETENLHNFVKKYRITENEILMGIQRERLPNEYHVEPVVEFSQIRNNKSLTLTKK